MDLSCVRARAVDLSGSRSVDLIALRAQKLRFWEGRLERGVPAHLQGLDLSAQHGMRDAHTIGICVAELVSVRDSRDCF